jgi:hypothetical protein
MKIKEMGCGKTLTKNSDKSLDELLINHSKILYAIFQSSIKNPKKEK